MTVHRDTFRNLQVSKNRSNGNCGIDRRRSERGEPINHAGKATPPAIPQGLLLGLAGQFPPAALYRQSTVRGGRTAQHEPIASSGFALPQRARSIGTSICDGPDYAQIPNGTFPTGRFRQAHDAYNVVIETPTKRGPRTRAANPAKVNSRNIASHEAAFSSVLRTTIRLHPPPAPSSRRRQPAASRAPTSRTPAYPDLHRPTSPHNARKHSTNNGHRSLKNRTPEPQALGQPDPLTGNKRWPAPEHVRPIPTCFSAFGPTTNEWAICGNAVPPK